MMLRQKLAILVFSLGLVEATIPPEPTTTTFVTPSATTNGYSLIPTGTTTTTATTTSTTATTSHTHTTHTTHSSHHTHKTHKHHHHHHHHHDPCHSSKHPKPCHSSKHHHKPCCETKTITTVIDRKPCCLYVFPCPTNTTSYVTRTSVIAPSTSQASAAPASQVVVAPTSQAGVCTPCTSYIYQTTRPSLVCTTMIFCGLADQSENCILEAEQHIRLVVSEALRDGGKVFINGKLVAFEVGTSIRVDPSINTSVLTASPAVPAVKQGTNDASSIREGLTITMALGLVAGLFML